MTKEIREMLAQKATLVDEAKGLLEAQKTAELRAKNAEIADINDRIEAAQVLEAQEARNGKTEQLTQEQIDKQNAAEKSKTVRIDNIRKTPAYADAFIHALRNHATMRDVANIADYAPLLNVLTEAGGDPAGSDGGFLVPIDFDNKIWELKKTLVSLANLVTVENVNTLSGWRAVEKAAAAAAFVKFTEDDDVPASEAPAFVKVTFSLEDYGGFLPISNDLLSDSPVNLLNYIARWYSRKSVITENSLILAALKALTPAAYDKTKGISTLKTTLNKTLSTAHAAGAVIVTNQSGFDFLDQLLDGNDRPLLQPDPTNATQYKALAKPVVVLDDAACINIAGAGADAGKTFAPVFVGDFKEYLDLFRKGATEMASTNIGGTAWAKNQTQVRAIMRLDLTTIDTAAVKLLRVEL